MQKKAFLKVIIIVQNEVPKLKSEHDTHTELNKNARFPVSL